MTSWGCLVCPAEGDEGSFVGNATAAIWHQLEEHGASVVTWGNTGVSNVRPQPTDGIIEVPGQAAGAGACDARPPRPDRYSTSAIPEGATAAMKASQIRRDLEEFPVKSPRGANW